MKNKTQGSPTHPFIRKAKRTMLIALSILLAGILVLAGVLQYWSHTGKPAPYLDEKGNLLPNSISEKVFIDVNGVQQGMFIKGRDLKNPVLLYLHGGMPDYFLTEEFPTGFEDHFTVAWWEMRGSGISYHPDMPRETLTIDQMIADTVFVTNYLRDRFGKEKIYLMGHSGGTFIGIQAAAREPGLYHAYIGVAQMSDQLRSEKMAYDYVLAQFRENGDTRMVKRLEAAPVSMAGGTPAAYLLVRDIAMHKLGVGTMHDMTSVVTGIILPSFQSREYTLREKVNMWRGKSKSGVAALWNEMTTTDLSGKVTELAIQVYFLEGIYDYTCTYSVAENYFEKITAPVKGFYTFEKSAHSPMFEEPEKVQKILLEDVLQGTNDLADVK